MCGSGGKERRKARLIGFDPISYRHLIAVPLDSTLAPLIAAAAVPRETSRASGVRPCVGLFPRQAAIGGPTQRQPHTNFVRYRSDTARADNTQKGSRTRASSSPS